MDKVGKDGTITVEEAKSIETSLDVVEGMQFDKGYLSPYFVTNAEAMEVVLDNPYILIHEKKISSLKDMLPLLEKVAKAGTSAPHHRGRRRRRSARDSRREQAPRHVASGSREGPGLRRSPQGDARRHRGPHRRSVASPKTSASSSRTSSSKTSAAPSASRSTRRTPRSWKATASRPTSRAASTQIRRQIEETTSDYDREKLQERLAKLAGGVAVINVGAATETEMKEKKARVEDALHATRAAVEEGIVPGGGVAFIRAQKALDNLKLEGDEAVGVAIIRRAIEEPLRSLADNAGQEGALIVQEVKKRKGNEGYNVATGEYEDLVKAGVVDPTKVTRSALQNAASISGLLLTTEAIITEAPEKEKARRWHASGGMGGGMGGMGGMDY